MPVKKKLHAVFDTEIIGSEHPVFLTCVYVIEKNSRLSYWHHKRGDTERLAEFFQRDDLTFVSFNGLHFDELLINAACCGYSAKEIKQIATRIIRDNMKSWDIRRLFPMEPLSFDHIDLFEVAPGGRLSLKAYEGRMHSPRIADLPFHFDKDLTPKEQTLLESYCFNDVSETARLFETLREAIKLRIDMSATYGIDLRSKSDPQIAEAVLKQACNMGKGSGLIPTEVRYKAPEWIKTKNPTLIDLVQSLENEHFQFDHYGAPIEPDWLKEPIKFKEGVYKVGLGGLHSQHDQQILHEANDETLICDFDVSSYYPSLLIKLGSRNDRFDRAYTEIYEKRLAAKKAGDKRTAASLKLSCNGCFGKLGSIYSPLYAPEMMLAITLTGQIHLLCMIDELTKIKGLSIVSSNTDGLCIKFSAAQHDAVLKVFEVNSKRTGFEWEETRYRKIALKDCNNYIAIKDDGSVKVKGLYAKAGVLEMKNPTMEICSEAASAYLAKGTSPERFIARCKDIRKFIAVRNVTGGGEQSGVPFGRIARWYMTTVELPPLRYVENGNKVPKTDGARICLELPEALPDDLDRTWYVKETYQILHDMGAYS